MSERDGPSNRDAKTVTVGRPGNSPAPGRPAARKGGAGTGVLARGARVGRYTIVEALGEGGMGEVYSASDPELHRTVAVKVLRDEIAEASADARARFQREAQAMASLSHPNVVAVYDVGEAYGRVFVAMELVDGKTLAAWLQARPRAWREVLDVFVAAGRGLAAAHAAGMVHRDFKPANVLIGKDGRARVVDFGLARSARDPETRAPAAPGSPLELEVTNTGDVLGTPAYMAPEAATGLPVGPRADQFSFCVALYEALAGKRPFSGSSMGELTASVKRGPAPLPRRRAPGHLGAVVMRGLDHDPERRYPSMDLLLAELTEDPWRTRRRLTIGAAAVLVVAGGIAAALALRGRGTPAAPDPCRATGSELGGVWDGPRHEALLAVLGPERFARAAPFFDTYAAQWTAARTDACRATHVRREQSDALLDLRMQCLARRRDELAAAVTALTARRSEASEQTDTIEDTIRVAAGLSPIAGCRDARALVERVPLPEDPARRARAEALAAVLARGEARLRLGAGDDAMVAEMEGALGEARALAHAPLLARALRAHAGALSQVDRDDEAEGELRDAVRAAGEGHDDEQAAGAWLQLLGLLVEVKKPADVLTLAPAVEAAVKRAGDAPELRAELELVTAQALSARGDDRAALVHAEASIALFAGDPAREPWWLAGVYQTLGRIRLRVGEAAAAAKAHAAQVALLERIYGPDASPTARARVLLATALSASGDDEHALAQLELALRGTPAHGEVSAIERGALLVAVGTAAEHLGRTADARKRYDAALALLEGKATLEEPAAHDGLGRLDLAAGDVKGARRHFELSYGLRSMFLGESHPDLALSLVGLAIVHLRLGERNEAYLHALNAVKVVQERLGPDSKMLVEPLVILAQVKHDEEAVQRATRIDPARTAALLRAAWWEKKR